MVTFNGPLYHDRPERISFGNKKLKIYNITDAATSGSTLTEGGMNRIEAVHATNTTDTSDTFKETISSHGGASTKNQVVVTPVTANDDGIIWVWGR